MRWIENPFRRLYLIPKNLENPLYFGYLKHFILRPKGKLFDLRAIRPRGLIGVNISLFATFNHQLSHIRSIDVIPFLVFDGHVLYGKLLPHIRQHFSYQLYYLCAEVLLTLLGKNHAPDYSLSCLYHLLDAEVNAASLAVQKATYGLLDLFLLGWSLIRMANEWKVVELILYAKTLGLIDYFVLLEPGSTADGLYAV